MLKRNYNFKIDIFRIKKFSYIKIIIVYIFS